jgi:hypothetical protein
MRNLTPVTYQTEREASDFRQGGYKRRVMSCLLSDGGEYPRSTAAIWDRAGPANAESYLSRDATAGFGSRRSPSVRAKRFVFMAKS